MLTVMAAVMLSMNWWLALLAFAVLPLILVCNATVSRPCSGELQASAGRDCAHQQFHAGTYLGMAVVQLFNREERAYQDFEAVNRQHMIAFKDTIFAYALYYPAVNCCRRWRLRWWCGAVDSACWGMEP